MSYTADPGAKSIDTVARNRDIWWYRAEAFILQWINNGTNTITVSGFVVSPATDTTSNSLREPSVDRLSTVAKLLFDIDKRY